MAVELSDAELALAAEATECLTTLFGPGAMEAFIASQMNEANIQSCFKAAITECLTGPANPLTKAILASIIQGETPLEQPEELTPAEYIHGIIASFPVVNGAVPDGVSILGSDCKFYNPADNWELLCEDGVVKHINETDPAKSFGSYPGFEWKGAAGGGGVFLEPGSASGILADTKTVVNFSLDCPTKVFYKHVTGYQEKGDYVADSQMQIRPVLSINGGAPTPLTSGGITGPTHTHSDGHPAGFGGPEHEFTDCGGSALLPAGDHEFCFEMEWLNGTITSGRLQLNRQTAGVLIPTQEHKAL